MTAKQSAVKRYVVRLSSIERDRLDAVIQKGKAAARQVLKARILLKADASDAGEGWSDQGIAERWTPASTPSRAPVSNWSRVTSKPR